MPALRSTLLVCAWSVLSVVGRGASGETPRTRDAIGQDLAATNTQLKALLPTAAVLRDAKARAAVAPQAIPLLQRQAALWEELVGVNPGPKPDAAHERFGALLRRERTEPQLLALGDPQALNRVKADIASSDPELAGFAKAEQLTAAFMTTADPAERDKLVDQVAALAHDSGMLHGVDVALANIVFTQSDGSPVADRLAAVLASDEGSNVKVAVTSVTAQAKRKVFENKPAVLSGTLTDGKAFSTDQWKGRVILVDFWASWCGPCKAELPRVKAVYKKYHDQGFEVLGVSNDHGPDPLKSYLAADPDLVWPQLFDAAAATAGDWHPLTKTYSIEAIPVMFLIDRHGVLRTVVARENFEELIPQLLKESATTTD